VRANAADDARSDAADDRLADGAQEHQDSQPDGESSGSKLSSLLPDAPRLPDLGGLPLPHLPLWARLILRILKRLAKHELSRLGGKADAPSFLESLRPDAVFEHLKPRLPIQEAVDVAVPLDFAWQQWSELRFLPEGVDRVVEIERDEGGLSGRIDGTLNRPWSAEVLDDRERESFAWKSTEGSDCAGLVTFHELSDRLTRLELTLDVAPRDAGESAMLLTHMAHRRARTELRRFKADLELVSPDVYANDDEDSSSD
jgi:uncharacterized membrane protein